MKEKLKKLETELAFLKAREQNYEIRAFRYFEEEILFELNDIKKLIHEKHNEIINLKQKISWHTLQEDKKRKESQTMTYDFKINYKFL